MRVLQHDAGGGRETTVSFGVALHLSVQEVLNIRVLRFGDSKIF